MAAPNSVGHIRLVLVEHRSEPFSVLPRVLKCMRTSPRAPHPIAPPSLPIPSYFTHITCHSLLHTITHPLQHELFGVWRGVPDDIHQQAVWQHLGQSPVGVHERLAWLTMRGLQTGRGGNTLIYVAMGLKIQFYVSRDRHSSWALNEVYRHNLAPSNILHPHRAFSTAPTVNSGLLRPSRNPGCFLPKTLYYLSLP